MFFVGLSFDSCVPSFYSFNL